MRNLLLPWHVLLLLSTASVAGATVRESVIVSVALPDDPTDQARPVYVAGGIATVLRFEKPVDPTRTKMLGWEGRFEPLLAGGKSVVLVPLQDLAPEDRLLLLVTLVDGTELPFTITAHEEQVHHQVNLFQDLESPAYLRAALSSALRSERIHRVENARYREEEKSADHALAALLVTGAEKQTPFLAKQHWALKDTDADLEITVFSGKGKAAVVLKLKNHGERTWSLGEARLTTATKGQARAVAVRSAQPSIPPGASGTVAIVADRSAFVSEKGHENLALRLFRHDGLMQAFVLLDHRLAR